jgi:hypothetical protein
VHKCVVYGSYVCSTFESDMVKGIMDPSSLKLHNELHDHDLHSLCFYLMFGGLLHLKGMNWPGVYHAGRNAKVVRSYVNIYEEKCIKSESLSKSYITTDGQSASLSCNKAHFWGLRPDFYYCQTVAGLLMWGGLSNESTGLSLTIASGPR